MPSLAETKQALHPKETGKSVVEKLVAKAEATRQHQKKRKHILYALSSATLLLLVGYFVRQFTLLYPNSNTGLIPPRRVERLDTTVGKQLSVSRLYELEEKNRHRDSLTLAERNKALDYIVMDWQDLYDVRKKQHKTPVDTTGSTLAKKEAASELLALLAAKDSLGAAGQVSSRKPVIPPRKRRKSASLRRRNGEDPVAQPAPVPVALSDPFNTGRASMHAAPAVTGENVIGDASHGQTSTARSAQRAGVVPAVVHGDHQVGNGATVTFRTLEDATVQGQYLPKNTFITAIAQFSNGRIHFTGFRAKVGSSGRALSFTCYDSNLMAGISYQDQGTLETEIRSGTANALTDAASSLSAVIPYNPLARASGNLARGLIRGSSRKRETFIHLSDGYKVFLEVQPET